MLFGCCDRTALSTARPAIRCTSSLERIEVVTCEVPGAGAVGAAGRQAETGLTRSEEPPMAAGRRRRGRGRGRARHVETGAVHEHAQAEAIARRSRDVLDLPLTRGD